MHVLIFSDPYVTSWLDPVPIILAAVITGCVLLLVVCPLSIFALLKSSQRREEKIERRETLRRSIRLKSQSATAAQSGFASRNNDTDDNSRPIRPPINNKFLNISGITMDDSSTDSAFKAKMNYNIPSTPASSTQGNLKIIDSSYGDSDLDPAVYSKKKAYPRLENEIPSVTKSSSTGFQNRGYNPDGMEPGYSGYNRVSIPPPYSPGSFSGASGQADLGLGFKITPGNHSRPSTDSAGYKASGESRAYNRNSPLPSIGEHSSASTVSKSKPPRPAPQDTAI